MAAQIELSMLSTSQTIPKFCRECSSLATIYIWYQMSHDSTESLSSDTTRARDISGNKCDICTIYNINGRFSSIGAILMAKEAPAIDGLVGSARQRGGTCSGCSKEVSCPAGSGDIAL